MSERPTYEPVGVCIYCGSTTYSIQRPSPLGDEHIIPFSLGGDLVLPEASCQACEKTINKYESILGQRIFGEFRLKYKMRSRRKKGRPTTKQITTNSGLIKPIPYTDYPAPFLIYGFGRATYLDDHTQNISLFQWDPLLFTNTEEVAQFAKTHDWDGKFRVEYAPVEFARCLAKIAHAYAVAEWGLDAFRPLLREIILSESDEIGRFIGGSSLPPTSVVGGAHGLRMDMEVTPTRVLAVVRIRLFTRGETPEYEVVVGQIETQKQIDRVIEKSGSGESIKVLLPPGQFSPTTLFLGVQELHALKEALSERKK